MSTQETDDSEHGPVIDTRTEGQKRADTVLKYGSVFLIGFGFIGWSLSFGVIADGAPWLGLGVLMSGSVFLAAGIAGILVHRIVEDTALVGETHG